MAEFDPSKPFEVVDDQAFDFSQPYEEIEPETNILGAAKDIGTGLLRAPLDAAASAASIIDDPYTRSGMLDPFIESRRKSQEEYINAPGSEEIALPGTSVTRGEVRGGMSSLGYSGAAMGASFLPRAAGAAIGAATGSSLPLAGTLTGAVIGWLGGAGAAGAASYQMDTNNFITEYRAFLENQTGKEITDEEFATMQPVEVAEAIKAHGLHEAGWEGIGNMIERGAMTQIFKGGGLSAKALKGLASFVGFELGSETATQIGQTNAEVDIGMRPESQRRSFTSPEDIATSAREVLPATVLLAGMGGGGAYVAGKIADIGKAGTVDDAINAAADAVDAPAVETPAAVEQEIIQANQEAAQIYRDQPMGMLSPQQPAYTEAEAQAMERAARIRNTMAITPESQAPSPIETERTLAPARVQEYAPEAPQGAAWNEELQRQGEQAKAETEKFKPTAEPLTASTDTLIDTFDEIPVNRTPRTITRKAEGGFYGGAKELPKIIRQKTYTTEKMARNALKLLSGKKLNADEYDVFPATGGWQIRSKDDAAKQKAMAEYNNNLPEDIRDAVIKMESDISQGEVGGNAYNDKSGTTQRYKPTNPDYIQLKTLQAYDKKHGTSLAKIVNKDSISKVIAAVRSGKELTGNNRQVWDYVKEQAANLNKTDTELVSGQEADRITKEGIDIGQKRTVVVGDLNQGDKVVVENKGIPDVVEHKGFDEEGNIILEDGKRFTVDQFDKIDIYGEKKAPTTPATDRAQDNAGDMASPVAGSLNPFRDKAEKARAEYERVSGSTQREKDMAQSFPLGVGFGRGSQSRRDKAIDSSVDRAVKSVEAKKNLDYLEAKAEAFDRGEINAQGRRIKKESESKDEKTKSLPIVNKKGWHEITKAQWAKTHNDYKSISVSPDGKYRLRSMMVNGGLSPVFITDMKETAEETKPEEQRIAKTLGKDDMINGITRDEAGDMLADGDEAILSHIREGMKKHGKMAMEDAIRNQEITEVAGVPKEKRGEIKERIAKLKPQIDEILNGKAATTKEPWQMTRDEFVASPPADIAKNSNKAEFLSGYHHASIKRALSEGKQVPPEVLADYPELQAKADQPRAEAVTAPPEKARPAGVKEKPESLPKQEASGLKNHDGTVERMHNGEVSLQEYKGAFKNVVDGKESILAELSKLTKDQILSRIGGYYRSKSDSKPMLVRAAYNEMLTDFWVRPGMFSYGMDGIMPAMEKAVDAATVEDLKSFADRVAEAREKNKETNAQVEEAKKDPKTLDDFKIYFGMKLKDGIQFKDAYKELNTEQQASYDYQAGVFSRGKRKESVDQKKTDVRVATQTTGAAIVEGEHSKHHYPIWSVQLSDKVDGDSYKTLLSTAKRMGGNYVNTMQARMWKTIWGFQFKDKASAEAFMKLAAGDKTEAQEKVKERRDAFADDRSQSAVERLNDMAGALDSRADESLSRDRKANTTRRAGFAASAEAAANNDKALANTMRNIANAITEGKAKFLDQVRQKVQVETLRSFANRAKNDELRDKYKEYSDREKNKGEPATADTARYAEFPRYTAYRSDLARLGRELEEIDGTKKLGAAVLKVADDVTPAYLKFAKENIHKVSTFTKTGGGLAAFTSKQGAEDAIKRSGYKGKAIVLPFKRGENLIIMSPSMAKEHGVWDGDADKRITLNPELGAEIVAKVRAMGGRNRVSMPYVFDSVRDDLARLAGMGIETPAEFRAALREFIQLQERPAEPDKIKELERKMIGRVKDGLDFFPTPAGVAQDMIDAADIQEGMSVLEPSAGMGHIAGQIRDAGFEPDVVEMSSGRRELLEAKGFNVVGRDFLDIEGQYDRIIMNPPFSGRRDVEHVQHAYSQLNKDGRLVALMGEGVFFGQDKKAVAFREWLDSVGGTAEKLEEGTFLDPSLPVNTGTNARMVVIDKQEAKEQEPKYSRSPKSTNTAEQVTAAISKSQRVRQLLKDGRIKVVQGMDALPGGAKLLNMIGPDIARRIKIKKQLPSTPEFDEAVANTDSAKITKDGLLINAVRYQKEDQEGAQSIRTGVFYLPAGSQQEKHYKTGKNSYGGREKFSGEILVKRPLFVKGATGGKAPENAYDKIMGKGSYGKMRADVLASVFGWNKSSSQKINATTEVLDKYGADSSMANEIVYNSKEGNTLPYAVQENIVAHAVRQAGYDSVIGYSKGKSGLFISEIYDVRETTYPANGIEPDIHESFQYSRQQEQIGGAYDPKTDTIYLVSDGIEQGQENRVLEHEAFHRMKEQGKIQPILDELGRLEKMAGKKGAVAEWFTKARESAQVDKGTQQYIEEIGAYAVQHYEASPNIIKAWVDKLIAKVKAAIFQTFGVMPKKIDHAFLREIALSGLRGDVEKGGSGTLFSRMAKDFGITVAEAKKQYDDVVAKFKGKDGWMRAPNGEPTKLNERQWIQTRTPAFKEWFGDSKVVDENGDPLVVYHGTTGDIEKFLPEKMGTLTKARSASQGYFFVNSPITANSYAKIGTPLYLAEKSKKQINQLDKELDVLRKERDSSGFLPWGNNQKIRDLENKKENIIDNDRISYQEKMIRSDNPELAEYSNLFASGSNIVPANLSFIRPFIYDFKNKRYREETYNELIEKAKNGNYDSVIFKNTSDYMGFGSEYVDIYVAFSPNQIKSAIGNTGQFSKATDDIRYSRVAPKELESLEVEMKDRWVKGKTDISRFDRMFSTIEKYAEKVPVVGRYWNVIRHRTELKFQYENAMLKIGGIDAVKQWSDLSNKDQRAFSEYMVKADAEFPRYQRKKAADGTWTAYFPDKENIKDLGEDESAQALFDREHEDNIKDGMRKPVADAVRTARMVNYASFKLNIDALHTMQKQAKEAGVEEPTIPVAAQGAKFKVTKKDNESGRAFRLFPTIEEAKEFIGERKNPGEWSYSELEDPQEHKVQQLKISEVLEIMGDIVGNYFPRVRKTGDYILRAYDKNGKEKYMKLFDAPFAENWDKQSAVETMKKYVNFGTGKFQKYLLGADDLHSTISEMKKKGWRVEISENTQLSEDVFEAPQLLVSMQNLLDSALESTPKDQQDAAEQLNKIVTMEIGKIFKMRGSLSSRLKRKPTVIAGYETDAIKAVISHVKSIAGGLAKRETSEKAMKVILGRDISWPDYKADNEGKTFKDYLAFVNERRIDPGKQREAYGAVMANFEWSMRNQTKLDRVVGTMKGLATLKYLGFRLSSPAVNMTNMVTGVPAAMHANGISFMRAAAELKRASTAYVMKRSAGDARIFDYIASKGWDAPQFNQDAAGFLQSQAGKGYDKVMSWAMFIFGVTEKFNRAATISASYRALGGKSDVIDQEIMEKARDISDEAHGVYQKETLPEWAMGEGFPAAMARVGYTFTKFTHNYLLNLKKYGFDGQDRKAATWLLISPAILSGVSASAVTPIIMAIAKAMGEDEPEEDFYKWVEENTGIPDRITRQGIAGAFGIDIRGSLGVRYGLPTTIKELLGAPYSVVEDVVTGAKKIASGEVMEGIEKIIPSGIGAPLKAIREYSEGITTESNQKVFGVDDTELKGSGIDAAIRAATFNPARLAAEREKIWHGKEKAKRYSEMKGAIYSEMRKYLLQKNRDIGDWAEILMDVDDYNRSVMDQGEDKLITDGQIKSLIKKMRVLAAAEKTMAQNKMAKFKAYEKKAKSDRKRKREEIEYAE